MHLGIESGSTRSDICYAYSRTRLLVWRSWKRLCAVWLRVNLLGELDGFGLFCDDAELNELAHDLSPVTVSEGPRVRERAHVLTGNCVVNQTY